jgi:hypothetical protein
MKYEAFIHNGNVKCLHVAIQGTLKMVVMGCINFENQSLIKRWQANEKMNAMGGKFKNEKNDITIESGFHFLPKVVSVFKVMEIIET